MRDPGYGVLPSHPNPTLCPIPQTQKMFVRQSLHLCKRHASSCKSTSVIDNFFASGPTWSLRELSHPTTTPTPADIDLDKLADLAHLDIPTEQRDIVMKDLDRILSMVSLVQEGAEGWTEKDGRNAVPIVTQTILRPDVVTEPDLSKEIMRNAKSKESGYFVVPNTQQSS